LGGGINNKDRSPHRRERTQSGPRHPLCSIAGGLGPVDLVSSRAGCHSRFFGCSGNLYTEWFGRSPTLIEDQITYPVVTSLLAGPRVKRVRGVSEYGVSYAYVIFEDRTDLYWGTKPCSRISPKAHRQVADGSHADAGTGCNRCRGVYQYALVDESGTYDLAQLRSLQGWYLRYQLKSGPGVAPSLLMSGREGLRRCPSFKARD